VTTSYARRRLEVVFTLGAVTDLRTGQTRQPTFGSTGKNTVTLTGYRIAANIAKVGGMSQGVAQLRIFGMPLPLMNELTLLGALPLATKNNTVSVFAGDDQVGMGLVFTGNITQAWANMKAAPQAVMEVMAQTGVYHALAPVPPTSFRGSADVATVLSGLAELMGVTFENNGVTAQISNPYFPGTAREQAMRCVQHAGIEWNGVDNGVLAIWPRGGHRGGVVPLISPETGMIGYPGYTQFGVSVQTLLNPSLTFGALFKVQSSSIPANGTWEIYKLAYNLESETPGGPWFTQIEGTLPGNVILSR
jgi:hypothetical protein